MGVDKELDKKGPGRKTTYTVELGEKVCDMIADGLSLSQLYQKMLAQGEPYAPTPAVVNKWALADADFAAKYSQARIIQAHALADELLAIAEDGSKDRVKRYKEDGTEYEATDFEHINRSRLRVDTRKWYLSKVLPKLYGDKIEVNNTGEVQHVHVVSLPRPESREEWIKAIQQRSSGAIEHIVDVEDDDTE